MMIRVNPMQKGIGGLIFKSAYITAGQKNNEVKKDVSKASLER